MTTSGGGCCHGPTKLYEKNNIYSLFGPLLSFRSFVPQFKGALFPQLYFLCCFSILGAGGGGSLDCLCRFLPLLMGTLTHSKYYCYSILSFLHSAYFPCFFSFSLSCLFCSWELKWHNSPRKPRSVFGHFHCLFSECILQTQVEVVQQYCLCAFFCTKLLTRNTYFNAKATLQNVGV